MLFRLPLPLILLFQAITSLLALRNTAFLFVSEGSVLFLGRLATYDAFCLCLLALAVMLSLRASKAASAQRLLAVGPLLVLAVAAKYAGLLFVPTVLALLAWWSWKHKGLEEMFVRLGIALFSLVVSGFIAFLNLDKQVLTGLSFTTTNRVSSIEAAPIPVMQHIVVMEGIFFGLGFLGLLLCGTQRLPTWLLLFGSALLVPLYHTCKGELLAGQTSCLQYVLSCPSSGFCHCLPRRLVAEALRSSFLVHCAGPLPADLPTGSPASAKSLRGLALEHPAHDVLAPKSTTRDWSLPGGRLRCLRILRFDRIELWLSH